MRLSAAQIVNLAGWAALVGVAGLAVVLVVLLGPFGLVVLGLLTVFVCTQFLLHDAAPSWSPDVFRARMTEGGSPEQRAALADQHRSAVTSVGFYRNCGAVLVLAGLAGLAWQYWG